MHDQQVSSGIGYLVGGEAAGLVKAVTDQADNLKARYSGLETGFDELDEWTCCLRPGEVTILAGRPGMGSTTMAICIAAFVAKQVQKTIAYFSLDNSVKDVAQRLVGVMGGLHVNQMRDGKLDDQDWERVSWGCGILRKSKLCLVDSVRSVERIREQLRVIRNEQSSLDLLIVDPIGMVKTSVRMDREERMEEVMQQIKLMALEFDIPILCLAGIDRRVELRKDKRPMLSDIRDKSGAIAELADRVIFIYRNASYREDSLPDGWLTEVIVAKNRSGPIGAVNLEFDGRGGRFRSLKRAVTIFE